MTAQGVVDQAIDSYHGDALEMVLIGADIWPDFLAETGLNPERVGGDEYEVVHRGVCRKSVSPDGVKLVFGD